MRCALVLDVLPEQATERVLNESCPGNSLAGLFSKSRHADCGRLHLEDVIVFVAELQEVGDASLLLHRRRSAHHCDPALSWREEMRFDEGLAQRSHAVFPFSFDLS